MLQWHKHFRSKKKKKRAQTRRVAIGIHILINDKLLHYFKHNLKKIIIIIGNRKKKHGVPLLDCTT